MGDSLDQVKTEFFDFLNDVAGAFGHACIGVRCLRERLAAVPAERVPGARMFIMKGDPNHPDSRTWQAWPLDTLNDRLGESGLVVRELGRQWVVSVFAHWEDHYRAGFARALCVRLREVTDPMMGDIRRLRHDIVHHRGIASHENAGGCLLIAHWVEIGSEIVITEDRVLEFMEHFGLVTTGGRFEPSLWEPTIRRAPS
jgi:hypothetical protein